MKQKLKARTVSLKHTKVGHVGRVIVSYQRLKLRVMIPSGYLVTCPVMLELDRLKSRNGIINRLGKLKPMTSDKWGPRYEQRRLFLEVDHQELYIRKGESGH